MDQIQKNDAQFQQWCEKQDASGRFRYDRAFYQAVSYRCSKEMILRIAGNWLWYDSHGQPAAVPYVEALLDVGRNSWPESFSREEVLALLEKKCFGPWTAHKLPSPTDHRRAARHDSAIIALFGNATWYDAFLRRIDEADEAERPQGDPEDHQDDDQWETEDE